MYQWYEIKIYLFEIYLFDWTGPTTTVLDGIERTVTITERKLCPTHLVGDSTVSPPPTCALDSPSPPPTLPSEPTPDLDPDSSVHTEWRMVTTRLTYCPGNPLLSLHQRLTTLLTESSRIPQPPLNLNEIPPPQSPTANRRFCWTYQMGKDKPEIVR
ncbi:hypothetical protein ACHWQZ_G013896 [Mnemiopsis leidyi]